MSLLDFASPPDEEAYPRRRERWDVLCHDAEKMAGRAGRAVGRANSEEDESRKAVDRGSTIAKLQEDQLTPERAGKSVNL